MLKCLGCKHFRPDLSHLGALEAYERQLVAARERLLAEAEVDGLEGWARQAALPSQEEIERVRYLIHRIREAMGELEPEDRAELQALVAAERTNRSAILERLPASHELNVLNVVTEVHGLGPKRTARIAEAWEEQKAIKEVMVFLSDAGVSTSLAVRIYKRYADESIPVVRSEPYRLASEVWGIGFETADTIAQAVGIPHDSPERIKAGLQYTLSEAAGNGHCYLPAANLIGEAAKILEVDRELIDPCLDELTAEEGVVREAVPARDPAAGETVTAVYLVPFHRAERSLVGGLLDLLNSSEERLPAFAGVDWAKALGWLWSRARPAGGRQARAHLTSRVSVLTGGPGCGKSFTVRSVVELATAKNATIVLVAPTGRAAKRLAELTGHDACTVHRLLELQPGGEPKYDRENPLDADLVVVDECSMMDVILANKLIKAIPDGAHLLMVGDVDQLPSVGAGEVLRDLLATERIPRVRLTEIFRQAQ